VGYRRRRLLAEVNESHVPRNVSSNHGERGAISANTNSASRGGNASNASLPTPPAPLQRDFVLEDFSLGGIEKSDFETPEYLEQVRSAFAELITMVLPSDMVEPGGIADFAVAVQNIQPWPGSSGVVLDINVTVRAEAVHEMVVLAEAVRDELAAKKRLFDTPNGAYAFKWNLLERFERTAIVAINYTAFLPCDEGAQFQCPAHSRGNGERECRTIFADCTCDDGYVKHENQSKHECVLKTANISGVAEAQACWDQYACPVNSHVSMGVSCLTGFANCTCDNGFIKDASETECERVLQDPMSGAFISQPCWGGYTCPAHSHAAKVQCLRDFEGCDCDWGFVKNADRNACVRDQHSFECPANSYFNGEVWPPSAFQDCNCFVDHVARNGSCAPVNTSTVPPEGRTSHTLFMEWGCINGSNCMALCPRNSWARTWPVTSFDDCSCDWGYERVSSGSGSLNGACVGPREWAARELKQGLHDTYAMSFTLRAPNGRQWTCDKLLAEADAIVRRIKADTNAAAASLSPDCALPAQKISRRRLGRAHRRLYNGTNLTGFVFGIDVYHGEQPGFGTEAQLDDAAEVMDSSMVFQYGSEGAPFVTSVAPLHDSRDIRSGGNSDDGQGAPVSSDAEPTDGTTGGTPASTIGGALGGVAFAVICAAAIVAKKRVAAAARGAKHSSQPPAKDTDGPQAFKKVDIPTPLRDSAGVLLPELIDNPMRSKPELIDNPMRSSSVLRGAAEGAPGAAEFAAPPPPALSPGAERIKARARMFYAQGATTVSVHNNARGRATEAEI
jgi:hypothetical protein